MIVIKLHTLTVVALSLFGAAVALIISGDVYGGDWALLAHIGLLSGAAGISLLVISWLERRLASVEKAFQIGVDTGQASQRDLRSL